MAKSHMTGKNAGRKREETAGLGKPFSLYDNCNICPMRVYVDMVCNDNLEALIIEGEPSKELLIAIKIDLVTELSELSNNVQASSVNNSLKKIYNYRLQIKCMQSCGLLIDNDMPEKALEYLKSIGINIPLKDKRAMLKRLEGQIKNRMNHLNQEYKKYESLSKDSGDKPTYAFYNEQLAVLSGYFKFDINMNITLAQYAAYLKIFNKSNHGKYNRK